MQAIAADLVENFKFALTADKPEIIRTPTGGIMSPMVKGREHEGVQMPLHVTAL
jgi:alkylphenol/PAH-inducible cytochrome P450 monooxygenase